MVCPIMCGEAASGVGPYYGDARRQVNGKREEGKAQKASAHFLCKARKLGLTLRPVALRLSAGTNRKANHAQPTTVSSLCICVRPSIRRSTCDSLSGARPSLL